MYGRQHAYKLVFDPKNPFVELVLRDLAQFCRADSSTFHPDPRAAANLDGRREVWLRIQENINLTADELWLLYPKGNLTEKEK